MHDSEKALQAQIANALLRANHMLGYENQLKPDDPLISFVALNETLYKIYLDAMKQTASEVQSVNSTALQQELALVKATTARMIQDTGGHLQSQLEKVALHWESKFRNTAAQEIANVQQITQIVYWGAVFWFLAGFSTGCIILAQYFIR
jgi:hypothetical protein